MSRIPNVRTDSNFGDLYVVDTVSMISSDDKDQSSFHKQFKYVSISPDEHRIVTFDPESYEVNIYDTEELVDPISTLFLKVATEGSQVKQACWSVAISNCIDANNERLIALSRFDSRDVNIGIESSGADPHDIQHPVDDIEFGGKRDHIKPETWVIFASLKNEVKTNVRNIGGVVRFLDNDSQPLKDQTTIVIINTLGIYKQTIQNSEIEIAKEFHSLFSRIQLTSDVEEFYLPRKLSVNLSHSDYFQDGLEVLHNSIVKNHFLINSYKNGQHTVEMYDLVTGDLEMLFQRHESTISSKVIHGLPIFAISQNDAILAFCRGTNSITLYLMENGLEIVSKKMMGRGFQKIISMSFIDNDSKLLIVLEEDESQVFVVWDLFTTHENTENVENAIRRSVRLERETPLRIDKIHRLLNFHEKILAVTDWGDLFSLWDNPEVQTIRNSEVRSNLIECEIVEDEIYHSIFRVSGDRVDVNTLAKKKLIINHIEPWQKDRKYVRVSAYLHPDKHTQLTIGHDTVQVWRYRRVNDSDLYERVLEYIWAKNGGARLQIRQLLIGEREFVLRLMVPSSEQCDPQPITIHWPNNVNVLEGACRGLRLLYEKKHEITGAVNMNRREVLVDHMQRLVRRHIKKSGLFRLTDIRYPIMENLIRSHQTKLIQGILKTRKNGKNMRLHIPRLHDWDNVGGGVMRLVVKKTDLQISIECTKQHANSTVIAEALLDYYADNAKDYNNPGWMLTVTQAIPLLYDYKLDNLVQELFRKPCFGTIEAYTPPLHISHRDQMKGNSTDSVHVIDTKPRLARKPSATVFTKITSFLVKQLTRIKNFIFINPSAVINTSYNDRKVLMVPLPDFTIYPNCPSDSKSTDCSFPFKLLHRLFLPRKRVIKDVKEMSPFLRVIFEDESTDLHKTPSINAVTTFKWRAASHYYMYQVILYVLFGISFGIRAFEYAININLTNNLFSTAHEDLPISIINILFLYTGWHLIVTEIVQAKNEGLRRYFDIYNVFDLGSVILPLVLNIGDWLYNLEFYVFTKILGFTILIMWFELLLLMRYFESPGRFIYIITNILNTIWPFFAFMLIAVLGFGNAMFILLKNAPATQFQVDNYNVVSSRNTDENLYPNLTIKHNVDRNSRLDNYYSNFFSSVQAVFFWTNGRWDQLGQWNSYAVDVMSILGSLILVLIFQNMLIAFMNGAFDKAQEDSHNAVQVFRADLIAEYETFDKPLGRENKTRYIYFIPNPNVIDSWLLYAKKRSVVRTADDDQFEFEESDDDYDDGEIDRKHFNESSTASNKTYSSEYAVSLVDEENTTEHRSRSVQYSSLKRSSSVHSTTTTLSVGSYATGTMATANNMSHSVLDNSTLFSIPEGGTSNIGVGEEVTPEQTVAFHGRLDDLEHRISQRMTGFAERFDALEQKLTTVLEFLSNQ